MKYFQQAIALACCAAALDCSPAVAQKLTVGIYGDARGTITSVELQPLQPASVFVVAVVDTGSQAISAWEGRLTGAIDNGANGLFVVSTGFSPESAINVGSGLEYSVGLGHCETVSAGQPLVLATLSIVCDGSYSDGRILFFGTGTSSTAGVTDCGGVTAEAWYSSHLHVRNAAFGKDASRMAMVWDHQEFPPRNWEIYAGIGTVTDFISPVAHPNTKAVRSHVAVSIEQSIVGDLGPDLTILCRGGIGRREDGTVFIARSSDLDMVYPKVGSRILFIAAKRPPEYWNYYEDRSGGLPSLYFARFLLGSSPGQAEGVYVQARTRVADVSGAFKSGRFDSSVLEEVLEPDGRTLDGLVAAIQHYYRER